MGHKVTIEFKDENKALYFAEYLESLFYGGDCDGFYTVEDVAKQIKENVKPRVIKENE